MNWPCTIGNVITAVCFCSTAQADTVSLNAADCQRLVRHVPSDDVNYKPGVDARGNAVAPADLGGVYNLAIPDEIHIEIGIDLADRLGLQENRRSGDNSGAPTVRKVLPYEGKAILGLVTIKGSDVLWNGERVTPQDELILAEACRQALEEEGELAPLEKPELNSDE
jgi:hypothetical protein